MNTDQQGHQSSGKNTANISGDRNKIYQDLTNSTITDNSITNIFEPLPAPPRSKYLNSFAHYDFSNLVGRKRQLEDIDNHFKQHRILLLHGVGGIGKTILAKAYIAQAKDAYQHIAYVEIVSSLAESMVLKLATFPDINLQIDPTSELEAKFEALIEQLRHIHSLLLVLDNVNEADDLSKRKKQLASLNAHVLITGRARPHSFIYEHLDQEVAALMPDEALELFKRYYTVPLIESEQLLVEEMLKQAFYHAKLVEIIAKAAYKAIAFVSLEAMGQIVGKKHYQDEEINFPIEIDEQTKKIHRVLLDLFDPSALPESAQQLLRYFAILPTFDIPLKDLATLLCIQSTRGKQEIVSELTKLVQGGWLEEESNRYFSVHGLVQWVVRQKLIPTIKNCDCLIKGVAASLYSDLKDNRVNKQIYLAYIHEWPNLFAKEKKKILVDVYYSSALIYGAMAEYNTALHYFLNALNIHTSLKGENDQRTIEILDSIGTIYNRQGNIKCALGYHEQALQKCKDKFKKDIAITAKIYNNIGVCYIKIGDYNKALFFLDKALCIYTSKKTKDWLEIARVFNNIGNVHKRNENYSDALSCHQKALKIRKEKLDINHREISNSLYNIGTIYKRQDQHTNALIFHQQALDIRLISLGEKHEDTIKSYKWVRYIQSIIKFNG